MINQFQDEFRWLSNFEPCEIEFEGITFPTTEHAFQAAKTLDFEKRIEIALLETPGQAKRAGKKLEIRNDWEQIKIGIMEQCLRLKFSQPKFAKLLKQTGTAELIEGNWWGDTFWGVCGGVGENWLGKLLMKIRDDLKVKKCHDLIDCYEPPK